MGIELEEKIHRRALECAYIRAKSGDDKLRDPMSDAMFADGSELISAELRAELEQRAAEPNIAALVQARTKAIDDILNAWLTETITAGADRDFRTYSQIVLLGCGLDMRHYRLLGEKDKNVVVFEVDHPAVLDARLDGLILRGCAPPCIVEPVGCDLGKQGDLIDALLWRGFRIDLPTIFIAESVLCYLPTAHLDVLFSSLARLAADSSKLVADVVDLSAARNSEPLAQSSFDNIVGSMNSEALVWHQIESKPLEGVETGSVFTAEFRYSSIDVSEASADTESSSSVSS